MRKLAILWTLVVLLVACPKQPPDYPYEKEPDPRSSEFVIGVADQLRITVWKNPELNTEIRVRPDGTITMPLIGDVQAAGLTPTQLKEQVKKRLGVFIKEESATVTVAVAEVNSYQVTVSGNVMQPGLYSSRSFLTEAEAIALAGGPTRFASADDTVLSRKGRDGKIRRIPINYEQIQEGLFLQQNLVLHTGDVLFVP